MSDLELLAGEGSLDGSWDPRLNIAAVRLKCWAPDLITALTASPPAVGVNLVENQPRTFSRSEAGDVAGYEVLIVLEGVTNPESYTFDQRDSQREEYTLEGSTSEDPIESHWNIQTLIESYKGETDDQSGRAKWPLTLPDGEGQSQRNPMHGVQSYLVPGLVWSRRWVARNLPASIVATLGTIETPPGNPPEIAGNRNWLKIRARAQWRGNIWQIEESWLLSGPGGWVPEIYQRK